MYEHGNVITSIKQVNLCNHKYKACKAIYKCKIYITYGQIFISKKKLAFQAKYR